MRVEARQEPRPGLKSIRSITVSPLSREFLAYAAARLTLRLLSALAGPAIRPARIPVGQSPRFLDLHLEGFGDRVGPAFTPRNPAHVGGVTSDLHGYAVVHSAIKRRQAIQIGVTIFIGVTISTGD